MRTAAEELVAILASIHCDMGKSIHELIRARQMIAAAMTRIRTGEPHRPIMADLDRRLAELEIVKALAWVGAEEGSLPWQANN